jgi:hypothetical protein
MSRRVFDLTYYIGAPIIKQDLFTLFKTSKRSGRGWLNLMLTKQKVVT